MSNTKFTWKQIDSIVSYQLHTIPETRLLSHWITLEAFNISFLFTSNVIIFVSLKMPSSEHTILCWQYIINECNDTYRHLLFVVSRQTFDIVHVTILTNSNFYEDQISIIFDLYARKITFWSNKTTYSCTWYFDDLKKLLNILQLFNIFIWRVLLYSNCLFQRIVFEI